ncbi:MAG: hypothetical protein M3Z13_01390, partial [Candidatus Dormibacteraeota bacterium]|nr:hypothetical protein [Candidatus Dormibacteraeota bacterium]
RVTRTRPEPSTPSARRQLSLALGRDVLVVERTLLERPLLALPGTVLGEGTLEIQVAEERPAPSTPFQEEP